MILKLKYFFAAVFMVLAFASCDKEYSDENGTGTTGGNSSGTAIFTLGGAPGACTGAIINGTYTTGIALGDSNTVDIAVNVDSVGTYAITTGTVSGISFNASGTFTAKGLQIVTLTGVGTPATAGNIVFSPGKNGCSFTLNVISSSTGGGGTSSGNYLTCNIANVNFAFDSTLTATSLTLSGLSNLTIDGMDSSSGASFSINLNSLGTITTGVYNLLIITNPSAVSCDIIYVDKNGTSWGGAASSQVGTFQVVVTTKTATRVEGTFSGTLYDSNGTGSNSLVVTNGKFSAPIQ